jgi:hypothetical protein
MRGSLGFPLPPISNITDLSLSRLLAMLLYPCCDRTTNRISISFDLTMDCMKLYARPLSEKNAYTLINSLIVINAPYNIDIDELNCAKKGLLAIRRA